MFSFLKKKDQIIIVSGLPRSGTSMMMRMMEEGGIEILTDNIRTADDDNLEGYYEFEKVKELKENVSWLKDAQGKAVKIISELLFDLPLQYEYKIIFMKRALDEVIKSQSIMLARRNEDGAIVDKEQLKNMYINHLRQIDRWVERNGIEMLYVNYNLIINNPKQYIQTIKKFLQKPIMIRQMELVINRNLYRNK